MTTPVLRLGRFQTEALLGEGGTTQTYRARLVEAKPGVDERRFVVTLLRDGRGRADAERRTRFVEAARRLAGLDQAGFVRVVELGEGPGHIYAACEFKAGVNLAQLRSQAAPHGSMDARLVGLLGRKIAERLAPLHARTHAPRAHGGLNLGNVLVSPDGEVFFLDCGLAEAVRPRSDADISRWLFAAPEQLAGSAAVPASDLYSVGALIFYLFTGVPPFTAQTADELREKIAAGAPTVPRMPPWLSALIGKLLSSEADLRPRTAAEVARQISAAMLAAEAGPAVAAPHPSDASGVASSQVVGSESVVPFALDQGIAEGEGPVAADGGAAARPSDREPMVPFSLEPSASEGGDAGEAADDDRQRGRSEISADDPDVGAVFDDDDEVEDQVEVGPDGKVKRRRRRRLRIPVWYRSALARKISRLGLIPLVGMLVVAAVAGIFFFREWDATRVETERRNSRLMAEAARRAAELRPPKPPEPAPMPAGQLVLKTTPAGATVWLDGVQRENTPVTLTTAPASHRLVVTLPGYRMLRDVVDTSRGALWERAMLAAPRLDSGRVPLTVTCATQARYPVFVDGRDSGELCPASDLRIEPGRHSIGVFVIPQNRIWTFDREVQLGRPHRVQFNY